LFQQVQGRIMATDQQSDFIGQINQEMRRRVCRYQVKPSGAEKVRRAVEQPRIHRRSWADDGEEDRTTKEFGHHQG
jgi:hypothetical protein